MIRGIRPILFAVAARGCHAASYYFDSERGAETNPGTSERAPWKTLDKLNARGFSRAIVSC